MAEVRVLFFAGARVAADCGEAEIAVPPDGWAQEEFWQHLVTRFPALEKLRPTTRLANKHDYMASGERISPGDEIALIPPVSGG